MIEPAGSQTAAPLVRGRQSLGAVARRVGAFAALALLVHGVGIVLGFAIGAAVASRQLGEVAAIAFSGVGMLLVSSFLCRKLEGVRLRAIGIGFDRPWLMHMMLGLLVGGGLIALAWLAFGWLGWADAQAATGSGRALRLCVGFVFCLVTALQEETVCRGYAFQVVYRRSPVVGLILGGLLFAGMHIQNTGGTDAIALANLFLAHLFYAAAYLRTRSLWLPIGLHTGWNFVEAFVLGMPMSGRVPKGLVVTTTLDVNLWTGQQFGPEGGLVVTGLLIAATAVTWFALGQRRRAVDLLDVETTGYAGSPLLPALAAPTAPTRRVLATDVLRGIAVLGILPMNMGIFALVPATVIYPYAGPFTDDIDIATWVLLRVFIGTKDLLIFSMLFGAGILMVERSGSAAGDTGTALHYRRMAVLLVFGLLHAYLIWPGDILVTYALCGSIVYLLRKLPPTTLATLGVASFMVPMGLLAAAHFLAPNVPQGMQDAFLSGLRPDAAAIADFNRVYGGSWLTQMERRVPDAIANETINVLLCMGWIAGGLMLLGMALHKRGVLTAESSDRSYGIMIAAALLAGFPLLIYSFVWSFSRQWRLPEGFLLGWSLRETSYLLIAMGWIGAVMLICRRGKLPHVMGVLGAAGRMALTNYLLQSIVCSFIFYGHGLGLVGTVDYLGQIFLTLAIWAAQLVLSPLWLRWFRFGPAEWLWRSLSYGRRQPMRIRR